MRIDKGVGRFYDKEKERSREYDDYRVLSHFFF